MVRLSHRATRWALAYYSETMADALASIISVAPSDQCEIHVSRLHTLVKQDNLGEFRTAPRIVETFDLVVVNQEVGFLQYAHAAVNLHSGQAFETYDFAGPAVVRIH